MDLNRYSQKLLEWAESYGPKVLAALLIFLVGFVLAKTITRLLRKAMSGERFDPTLVNFLANLTYLVVMAFVIITAISKLGVNTTSFAAAIAAAGLAIGLALQGSLGNFASGVMLIGFRPIKVGDFVEVAGTSGTVESVEVFATRLRTPDNKAIVVPNGAIMGNNIINYSAKDTRRVDLEIGIGYDDDLRKAKNVLAEILGAEDRVLADPEPQIAVKSLGDNAVILIARPWVATEDYWAVYFALTEAIKLRFDEEGISFPYPQRDVHLHQVS